MKRTSTKRRAFLKLTLLAVVGESGAAPEAPTYRKFRLEQQDFLRLQLHWKRADGTRFGTLAAVHRDLVANGQRPLCLMNAGIFDLHHAPLGLHRSQGREWHPLNKEDGWGNFFLKPNGVFAISQNQKTASIRSTQAEQVPEASLAVQSGPLLVLDGKLHPAFRANSSNRKLRNGIGVDRKGAIVLAISTEPVCFHDFAQYFLETEHCPNALYLDGSISQCWLASEGQPPPEDQEFAGILAVVA